VSLLRGETWVFSVQLGTNAFQDMNWWAATTALICHTTGKASGQSYVFGTDVTILKDQQNKAALLKGESVDGIECSLAWKRQESLLGNPDARIAFEFDAGAILLSEFASSHQGIKTGDDGKMRRNYWELSRIDPKWKPFQSTVEHAESYGGRESLIDWSLDGADCARLQGLSAFGKWGVGISQMRELPCTIFSGEHFDSNVGPLIVKSYEYLLPVWCYCESGEYTKAIRTLDTKVAVANATLVKVPFNLADWQKVAAEKYPHGLPKPFSSHATQWLFNGHPAGSDQPLQVAVARLLGYQWPRQTGSSFPDCPALGPDGLETLADEDGIVCLASVRGEASAVERLRKLLASALGNEWSTNKERELLLATAVDNNTKKPEPDLESWLRNSFFNEHCKLFHSRPFIWQIWDGHVNGFSALVNYHKLAAPNGQGRKTLDQLTFTYLGDWIDRQKDDQTAGIDGADDRLAAALDLQGQLKKILAGEPPYDIFVRWKPLHQQAIGWEPDINDGVRLNIRPFLVAQLRKGGKTGAGILRAKPGTIKWAKDRGKEPLRSKEEFPWFWGWDENDLGMNPSDPTRCANFGAPTDITVDEGRKPRYEPVPAGNTYDGNRWNDLHYSRAAKEAARVRQEEKQS
jgi:hypothetical protein